MKIKKINEYIKSFNNITVPVMCGYGMYRFYLDLAFSPKVSLFVGLIIVSCISPIWRQQ